MWHSKRCQPLSELEHVRCFVPKHWPCGYTQECHLSHAISASPSRVCCGCNAGAGQGRALWIVPDWSEAPDPAAVNVVLTPGVAFGTGDHATTRLCLRWLHGHPDLQVL